MDFLSNSQLNIGIFYNIFICIILGISSFALVRKVTPRFAVVDDKPTFYNNYLRYFWLNTGFFWMLQAVRLFFNWRNDIILDKIVFYINLGLLSVASLFLFMYGLSVLFKKYTFNPFFGFVSAILAGLFLFFAILEGITVGEQGLWNASWQLTFFSQDIYLYTVYFFGLGILLLNLFRELFYYVLGRLDKFQAKHVYALFGFILYYGMFFTDFIGINSGWHLVLTRALLLIPIFIIYFGFSADILRITDKYLNELTFFQKLLNRKPLLFKSLSLVFVVSLIPLSIAASFIYVGILNFFNENKLQVDASVIEFVQGQIILIALVIGILTFFMGLSWVRSIVMRLRYIYKGTQEIAGGNFEYYIDESGSKDEIRLLSYLANQISYYLQEYKNTVIESSQGLEQRVKERTEQLEGKNQELNQLVEKNNEILDQMKNRSDVILENMAEGLLLLTNDLKVVRMNRYFKQQFLIVEDFNDKSIQEVTELQKYSEVNEFISTFVTSEDKVKTISLQSVGEKELEVELKISRVALQDGQMGLMVLSHDISPPWGTVKNSETKQPIKLAMVRLIDAKTNHVIDTEVTDPNGRFGFFVAPGKYLVSVMKDGYHFPPKNAKGYQGEMIETTSSDEGAIKFDIYMDPVIDKDDIEDDKTMVVKQKNIENEETVQEKKVSAEDLGDLLTVQELQKNNSNEEQK